MRAALAIGDQALVDPVTIDPGLCIGCDRCVNVCPVDLFLPSPGTGEVPLVLYPGECWYEGSCVDACPVPGAITLHRPPAMRVNWKSRAACTVDDGADRAGDGRPGR